MSVESLHSYQRAKGAVGHIREITSLVPRVGIILGSGLGGFADAVETPTVIPYGEILSFPRPGVDGHAGNLLLGHVAGVPVAVMQGRTHLYEGHGMHQVIFPTRVLGLLGCDILIVTNAAGGINPGFVPGSLVAISDHINLTGTNAVLGPNEPHFGVRPGSGKRFFDMTEAYSSRLRGIAAAEAGAQGYKLDEGVYIAVLGPSFETPAEIRAFRTLGADLVGMSTVHEVIVARHMGMEVLGLSLVTNAAAGVTSDRIDHEDVMEIGRQSAERFSALLRGILPKV